MATEISKKKVHGRGMACTVVTTRLNAEELRDFKKARKYVISFCGKVSDAEVIRFLVRNWAGK
jgi:hypothetical protein